MKKLLTPSNLMQIKIAAQRKFILIVCMILTLVLCTSIQAQNQNINETFKSELSLYRTVCTTQLIGEQAGMTDELISKANGNISKLFLIAEPLSHTKLVGRQLGVIQFLWKYAGNFETQLRVAKLASQTKLVGMQASTIDVLLSESWNDRERLARVMNVLSHTQLVGRQQQVIARLQQLGT